MSKESDANNSQNFVVPVDNFITAQTIIKTLRSSSNSNRCYNRGTSTNNDVAIENLEKFNKIIAANDKIVALNLDKEAKVNDSISNFKPAPIRYIVTNETQAVHNNGKFLYTPSNNDTEDFLSSDDEQIAEPHFFQQQGSTEQFNKEWSSDEDCDATTSTVFNKVPPTMNLLSTDDDEEAENAELFTHFTAPTKTTKSNVARNKRSTVSTKTDSLIVGSAGIRGIQSLLLQQQQTGDRDRINSGALNTSTAILLKAVKPGQAIRVRPPGKNSKNIV